MNNANQESATARCRANTEWALKYQSLCRENGRLRRSVAVCIAIIALLSLLLCVVVFLAVAT